VASSKESGGRIRKKNKALILNAAKTEFVTHGFKGASIKRIAERAEIPRANIHYYFEDKTDLYQQLLTEIIDTWNKNYDTFNEKDDPKEALKSYIQSKVMYSRNEPEASRIFASEIIHGAPVLVDYLSGEFKEWVESKVAVINAWIDAGKIDAINPYHLLFLIWGSTQHYADFNVQVLAAVGKKKLTKADYQEIADSVTGFVLKACGIKP